jgi:putative transposase
LRERRKDKNMQRDVKINMGHKIRLYPNKEQEIYFKKACGIARFSYNWALEIWKLAIEEGKGEAIQESDIRKGLNAVKEVQFPWMLEVSKCVPQLAIRDNLGSAMKRFSNNTSGFPQFHKKGRKDSFALDNLNVTVKSKTLKIPKLSEIKMAEKLRFNIDGDKNKITKAVVSRTADRWYVSINVQLITDIPNHPCENQAVGIDLGIKNMATLSDGTKFEGSNASSLYEKKLRRLNQELSRKKGAKKGEEKSNKFKKTQLKIARLHAKIANLRSDYTHKVTTEIVKNNGLIGMEDLHTQNWAKNHNWARSVMDMSLYEFKRQIEYKSKFKGGKVIFAKTTFPSSKLCSACGRKNEELELSQREWTCKVCGTSHDRDINAAINLEKYAILNVI